jgi:uracil phosphoribosyltransferase
MKQTILSILRNRHTTMEQFRSAADQLGTILAAESAAYISKKQVTIETPLTTMSCQVVSSQVMLVVILRAGLTFLPPFLKFYPNALIGFLGERRDEKTAIPYLYYSKLPPFTKENPILLLDPMLATGGSACLAIKMLKEAGATESQITLISAVAAPEGVQRLKSENPGTHLIIAQVDDKLDEHKYIVPGLGDFGDRYFGTIN